MFKAMYDSYMKNAAQKMMKDKMEHGCFGPVILPPQEPVKSPVVPSCFPNLQLPSLKPKI